MSALLVVAGGSWLLAAADVVSVDIAVIVAIGLAMVGIVLVASAWFGRARGLIGIGIVLALAVAVLGAIDVPLRGGIGDPVYRPRSLGALDRRYDLAIGELTLDLRALDLTNETRRVRVGVGIGEARVRVPPYARIVVDGHASVGNVSTFRRRTRECCPADLRRIRPGLAGAGTLHLTTDVGIGTVEVTQ